VAHTAEETVFDSDAIACKGKLLNFLRITVQREVLWDSPRPDGTHVPLDLPARQRTSTLQAASS
jgi:hypothetical protein